MNRKTGWFAVTAGSLLFSTSVWAQAAIPTEEPTLNRKVRNLGMGNVGIAIHGTGDSSPFYNPAGLNDLTEGRFQFLAMTFDVAANSVRAVNGILDLKDDVNRAPDDAGKVDALNNYINKHSGEFDHL
ncbi:MAG: hypothetical protein V1798_04780, partial [Pseudomonadota bacterium]